MVDLESIKREVDAVCKTIDNAFIKLADRSSEADEAAKQIDRLKTEIVLLNERKANAAESAREEERIAGDIKKEHTEVKNKYRKLIDEVKLEHSQHLAECQSELDSMRMKGISLLKSEQGKITSEINIARQELENIRKEYTEFKDKLLKLKEGITV